MSKPSMQSGGMPRTRVSNPIVDKFSIVPISACIFALIASPLIIFLTAPDDPLKLQASIMEARPETRIFWPVMCAISAVLAVQNRSRHGKLTLPPHIICLLVYLAFAGASVLWAFSPERSLIRFAQQVMIVISIVLPALLAARTVDMVRGLFLCFALALILNVFFVLSGSATIAWYGSMHGTMFVNIGYEGYFEGKNYLGECAAVGLLLSFHELFYPGWRRILGIIVVSIAMLLVYLSDSKTALGLAFVSPFLAGLTFFIRKMTRISPAIILLTIPLCYIVFSSVSNVSMSRLSYMLYGDSTLTGRTTIWDFAQYEIARKPLLGWGYQSFWLVPDSPATVEAPGWVKMMPNSHNGYYDTMLEMGYVGLAFLLVFIVTTLHAIGRVADRDPARAQLVLSVALFIILYNYFESLWMRGFEFLWVVFVILAAEIGRYWQPFPLRRAAYRSRSSGLGSPGPSTSAQTPRMRVRLS
jgi:exopolysaccharide production protein ExoQ